MLTIVIVDIFVVLAVGPIRLFKLIRWGWDEWRESRYLLKEHEEWYASLQRGEHRDSYEKWHHWQQAVRTRRGRKRWYEP